MTKTILALLISAAIFGSAAAQSIGGGINTWTGGSAGSGTVTSVATACQATGGPITTTGTISTAEIVNLQTGNNYAILSTDCGALVQLQNAGPQTPTIAAAGSAGFANGYFVDVVNTGAGTQTITPATSTINGAATYALAQNQGVRIVSDGANYQVLPGAGGPALPVSGANGGTGVANTGKTITLGASVTTTGAGAPTLAFPGTSRTYTFQDSADTIVGRATTDTLTNKTYDTAGAGNSFLINGVAATANTGTGSVVRATTPTLITPNIGVAIGTSLALGGCTIGANALCVTGSSALGNTVIGAGSAITSSGAGGSIANIAYQVGAAGQVPNGVNGAFTATPTLGASGTLGSVTMGNATSGLLTLQPAAGALGTINVLVPAAADTLVNLASIQTLTNKTIAIGSNTLTGVAPLASPTFTGTVTGPDAGAWASTGLTGLVSLGVTGGTLGASSTASFQTITGTWNDAGTVFKGALLVNITNTASSATSLLIDAQIGGASQFKVDRTGVTTAAGAFSATSATATSTTGFTASNNAAMFRLRNGSTIWSSPATAVWQSGNADAASAVAQTIQAQSVAAGNANTAGATFTIAGSKSNGSGGGDMVLQTTASVAASGSQNALVTAVTLKGGDQSVLLASTTDASASSGSGALQIVGGASVAKRFWIPAITASSGLQTAVLCQSSGGEMIADSVACLASGAQFKNIIGAMPDGALGKLMKLPIDRWEYKPEGQFASSNWTRERIGPIAQDVAAMDDRLAGYDSDGNVRTYSTEQLLAFTIKALQEYVHAHP